MKTANEIIQLLQKLGEVYADDSRYNEREKYERMLSHHKFNLRRNIPNIEKYNLHIVYYFHNNKISVRNNVKVEKTVEGNFTIQDFNNIIAWY